MISFFLGLKFQHEIFHIRSLTTLSTPWQSYKHQARDNKWLLEKRPVFREKHCPAWRFPIWNTTLTPALKTILRTRFCSCFLPLCTDWSRCIAIWELAAWNCLFGESTAQFLRTVLQHRDTHPAGSWRIAILLFPGSGVQEKERQGWEVLRTRAEPKQTDKHMRTKSAGFSSLEFYKKIIQL